MSKILDAKKAKAANITRELETIKTLLDVAPADRQQVHYERAEALLKELAEVNEDIKLCQDDSYNPAGFDESGQSERTRAVNSVLYREQEQKAPAIVRSSAESQKQPGKQTRAQMADKVLFRSGELMADKYDTTEIDAEKCLRAAITGDCSRLNDAEKRSVTPSTGGAMLAPEVSSLVIDNLRQTDWMQVFAPTIVDMSTGETKIPNITTLPTAVMHTPGEPEDSSDPTIGAATLKAHTIMTVVEVANELLQDSGTSQGVVLQAAIGAISNKLLQQILYGTGIDPEIKGITEYDAGDFASAGDKSAVSDVYRLVTAAKAAIIKNNGTLDAMLYDCDLENRLDYRDATGNLIEPPRALAELYTANKVLSHPSIASGDMLFMQSNALYIGIRQGLEIQVDPYSSFNSNNTKFRVIMRVDALPNTKKMVYYSGITAADPK